MNYACLELFKIEEAIRNRKAGLPLLAIMEALLYFNYLEWTHNISKGGLKLNEKFKNDPRI